MASLSPVVVGNTIKLDLGLKKALTTSLQVEKRSCSAEDLDKAFDSSILESRGGLPLIRREGNTKLDSLSYVPLLQECMEKNSVSGVRSVHAHIIKTEFFRDYFIGTFLVNVYSKCGMIEDARRLFDELPSRNVITWTSLISGYAQNSQPDYAIGIFKEMLEAGVYPTNHTLGIVLKACSSLSNIEFGKQIHGYIVKYDVEHDASTGNALCSLFSKSRRLDMALKAFQRIKEKDVISWTAVIFACGDNEDSAMGLHMFVQMLDEGIEPNEITLTSVISLCCTMHALDVGCQIHSLSIKLGYGSDLAVANSFMYLYVTSGCVSQAKKLFDGMETASLVAWNAMIAGHAEITSHSKDGVSAYSCGIEALKMFQRMNKSNLQPDSYTFSSVLTLCSSLVALEQGEQVHAQTIKTGNISDVVLGTSLVNMYNKCGSIDRASRAFSEMSTRTLISWTSMISAFAQHGYSQQALDLFEDMRFVGVRPNKITFVGLLSACSQTGMVREALAYYRMMIKDYKINPVMDHLACLVHMFVRLGQIDEAFDFIKNTDLVPNEFIWSILIAGCRTHEKLELAFYAADQLLELKPKDPETYFLLLNMYLSAGRWNDVSRVRKMMRDEKVDKITDWSWITIRNKVHSFKFPNKKQPSDEVSKLLEDLLDRARSLGHRPETYSETVVVDDEKGDAAGALPTYHSEKLAVAYGLLSIPCQAEIRIVKSIGMCKECHNFMKIVSMLTSRTIIIRDSKRLHKFFQGQCSCGDFGGLV